MMNRTTSNKSDIQTSLKQEDQDLTIRKITAQSQIKRALNAIRKGKFAYTF